MPLFDAHRGEGVVIYIFTRRSFVHVHTCMCMGQKTRYKTTGFRIRLYYEVLWSFYKIASPLGCRGVGGANSCPWKWKQVPLEKKVELTQRRPFCITTQKASTWCLGRVATFCDNHVTRLEEWILHVRYLASLEILHAYFSRGSNNSSGSIVCPQATLLGLLHLVLLFML